MLVLPTTIYVDWADMQLIGEAAGLKTFILEWTRTKRYWDGDQWVEKNEVPAGFLVMAQDSEGGRFAKVREALGGSPLESAGNTSLKTESEGGVGGVFSVFKEVLEKFERVRDPTKLFQADAEEEEDDGGFYSSEE